LTYFHVLIIGKHYIDNQKVAFLTKLKYHLYYKAALLLGNKPIAIKELKTKVRALEVLYHEQGLPPPTIKEKITRKEGSGGDRSTLVNLLI